jgi:hypothetical protein
VDQHDFLKMQQLQSENHIVWFHLWKP